MAEFRNPNQSQGSGGGGGDMRSLFGIMLLTMVILFGYQYFFKPKEAPPKPQQTQTQQTQQTPAPAAAAPQSTTEPTKTTAAAGAPAVQTPTITAAAQCDITVENELYKITFSNRGGEVKNWILKRYNDSAGKPLDMVQQQAAEKFGRPLSLYTYEPALNDQLTQALYQVNGTPEPCGNFTAPQSLTFHYAGNGLDVVKTIKFDSSYVVNVESQVHRNGQLVRSLVAWPSGFGDQEELDQKVHANVTFTASSFAWSLDGKQDYQAAGKVSGNATLEGDYDYAATGDLFFAAAFMPDAPSRATVVTFHHAMDVRTNKEDPSAKRPEDVLGLAMGDTSGYTRTRLYVGPKQMEVLASIHTNTADGSSNGPDLKELVQFGWMKWISYPLYLALRFIYEHGVGNWGWSIIIITALFNLIMIPTRLQMQRQSLKMIRIQPQMNAIKARYAHYKVTDPRRAEMNQEIMALHKQENINMYGGCLPMLIQMPLFIALYRLLANVIELRQAHWLWIGDLSIKEPFPLLIVVIIVGMFVTQWITPSPGMDASQRRMMAFMMPVVMGFTLSNFAAGLSVYWATGNVINLLVQLSLGQTKEGKELRERAKKQAAKRGIGGTKTIPGKR